MLARAVDAREKCREVRQMRTRFLRRVLPFAWLAALAIGACERVGNSPPTDTASALPSPPPDSGELSPPSTGWIDEAGPVLLVAVAPTQAAVVFPHATDSTLADSGPLTPAGIVGSTAELFARAGAAGSARLAASAGTEDSVLAEGCVAWPTVRVARSERAGRAGGREWTVGLLRGHAASLPLDSLEAASRADSARITASVARLASTLPNDTAEGFHGLPFAVRGVRRFQVDSGTDAFVADVVRRINQEANPREEHILLVAERQDGGEWVAAYSERSSGKEETIEVRDVLAALALGANRQPAIVIARDHADGFTYSLVTRSGPRSWRLAWSSAYTGC